MDRTVVRALDRQLLILLAQEDSDVSDSSGASRHSSMPPLIDAPPLTRSRPDLCFHSDEAADEWHEQARRCRHRAKTLWAILLFCQRNGRTLAWARNRDTLWALGSYWSLGSHWSIASLSAFFRERLLQKYIWTLTGWRVDGLTCIKWSFFIKMNVFSLKWLFSL